MRHKKLGLGLALLVLVLVLSAVLGATVLREPIAYAATPFQNVLVTNTAANPVPVTAGNPLPVKPVLPADQFSVFGRELNNPISGVDPGGTRYAITSFTITNFNDGADVALLRV